MRVLTTVLLGAVLVVLSVVAYDLHRVANVMATATGIGAPTVALTRDQRRAQAQQQMRELDEYFEDITTPPQTSRPKTAPKR
jgi:hypothetical protein